MAERPAGLPAVAGRREHVPAVWSARILTELEWHEASKLQRRGVPLGEASRRAARLVGQMRAAFDDSEIVGWEGLEGRYGLPDPDDEHVVAAAVVGGAGAIVTWNRKDFPSRRLPQGIDVLAPADFASNTVQLDPSRGLRAVSEIARRSGTKGPRRSIDEVLDVLVDRYHLDESLKLIRASM
jgi:predicted nucleic acid-binding protein